MKWDDETVTHIGRRIAARSQRRQVEDYCQVCGAPAGEPHGESQSPVAPYVWEVTCGD